MQQHYTANQCEYDTKLTDLTGAESDLFRLIKCKINEPGVRELADTGMD